MTTQGFIPIPFAIGVEVWWVGNGYREEMVACPECCGSRAITMILGNGEHVSLGCALCGPGYQPPTGQIKRTYYQYAPERYVPELVRIDGEEVVYHKALLGGGYRVAYPHDMFTDKTACQDRCDELNKQRTAEEDRRATAILQSKRRELAYSATYWRQQVKKLEDDLARVKARLAMCKTPKKDQAS